jgi:hypothetical protein
MNGISSRKRKNPMTARAKTKTMPTFFIAIPPWSKYAEPTGPVESDRGSIPPRNQIASETYHSRTLNLSGARAADDALVASPRNSNLCENHGRVTGGPRVC